MCFRKVQQGIVNSENSGTILWRNIEIFPVFIIKHLITGCLGGETITHTTVIVLQ